MDPETVKAINQAIRTILTAPNIDLATISSKRVRKELSESFGQNVVKQHKEAIDALIIEAFNEIATAAGATGSQEATASKASQSVVKTEENIKALPPSVPTQPQTGVNGSHVATPKARKVTYAESASENSSSNSDRDDGSAFSQEEESDHQTRYKPKSSQSSKMKESPQKRRMQNTTFDASQSSPSIPLSMTTGLTDEEYARQLQAEMNAVARGRSTRGGGYQKSTSKGSSSKRKFAGSKNKKVKSKAYISDSDGEDGIGHHGNDENDISDANEKPKKRKTGSSASGAGGGTGGGYNKEMALSESLQTVCGAATMSRPQVVKQLWVYIREHNLQDPNKKSDIINDELFRDIFGVDRMTMFSMNKYLKKSLYPIT